MLNRVKPSSLRKVTEAGAFISIDFNYRNVILYILDTPAFAIFNIAYPEVFK